MMSIAGRTGTSLWFSNLRPNPEARLRLFCFPYGGGNATVFQRWPEKLPSDIEIWALNLPGRGRRLVEPAYVTLAPLVEAMTEALLPLLNKAFVFFGHSMGALIAFETVRQLRRLSSRLPERVFIGACFAPHLPDPHPIHHLPEDEFIQELRNLNGIPEEVLQNRELLELVLPSLRADFAVTETYVARDEVAIPCPISVFGGWRDPLTTRESLEAWRRHTTAQFSLRMLPGDHFFLSSQRQLLVGLISEELQ
jgi:medium-chain acyl-[acyl-carrier-protein] hydrolase